MPEGLRSLAAASASVALRHGILPAWMSAIFAISSMLTRSAQGGGRAMGVAFADCGPGSRRANACSASVMPPYLGLFREDA